MLFGVFLARTAPVAAITHARTVHAVDAVASRQIAAVAKTGLTMQVQVQMQMRLPMLPVCGGAPVKARPQECATAPNAKATDHTITQP